MEESRSPEPELESGDRYSDEEQVIQEETTSGKEEEEEEERDDWKQTINKVVPAVVVLQVTTCRSFDTEQASSGSATGFIVDKKRGIILTNRHVVRPGPVVAQAIFVNHEEFPVRPVYIDPVHDFGFFQYDPDAIQFLEYEEITLAPEAACVGLEIRVVGNDSREKVSISAGTLARLDRNAPAYKSDGYRDFNTFYIQAASGTKGGSSGSPVIDRQGRAVAMNAGGALSASTAFFLPLERAVRALTLLQMARDSGVKWKGNFIPRGTLQVTFSHQGFDEARRLGLQTETEKMVRHASPLGETGMLVVVSVVPGGPAETKLEPGDVLVRVKGDVTTRFLKLETLLDDNVDQQIEIVVERGGTSINVNIMIIKIFVTSRKLIVVCATHLIGKQITGEFRSYLRNMAGSKFAFYNPRPFLGSEWCSDSPFVLSAGQARNFRFECGLVYVSDPGYMLHKAGIPRHAIIKRFSDVEISSLEDIITVLSKLPKGSRVPLEYINYKDRHSMKYALVAIDRYEWYDTPKIYTRNDESGLWIANHALVPQSHQVFSNNDNAGQDTSNLNPSLISRSANEAGAKKLTSNYVEGTCIPTNQECNLGKSSKQELPTIGVCLAKSSFNLEKFNTTLTLEEGILAATNASSAECLLEPALVRLEVNVPSSCYIDGIHARNYSGTGVIIYHSSDVGLIVVDQNTTVISACDVMISFAAYPIEIPGEVVFLHPVSNFALVAYDPSALGIVASSLVRAAELLPRPALNPGDHVCLIGLNRSLRTVSRKSVVTNAFFNISTGSANSPRFRALNMEVIELDNDFGPTFTGILSNDDGKVQALWGSFSTTKLKSNGTKENVYCVKGIPIYMVSHILDKAISGANGAPLFASNIRMQMPHIKMIGAEFCSRLLSKAQSFGLHESWIQVLANKDPMRRQVLRVKRCFAGSKAEKLLKDGDMLLAINNEPVTCFRDLENACLALEKFRAENQKLSLLISRQGREVELEIETDKRDGNATTRVIHWSGCVLQEPHLAVCSLGFLPKEGHGVYVSRTFSGTPAVRYGLHALRWIVEVNGKRTPNLDDFINVTKDLRYDEFFRLRTIDLNGRPQVLTLKQDLHYWPTWELVFDANTGRWCRQTIKEIDCSNL